MGRNAWGATSLTDKYLNFYTGHETSAAVSTLQTFEYDTGMTPRGGYIWEIHQVELYFSSEPSAVAAGALKTQAAALSFIGSQTVIPRIDTYGTVWRRTVLTSGNGTYNQPSFFEPPDGIYQFVRPMLYAKNKLYLYFQGSVATTSNGVDFRIGYTTKKISGPLLWEAVEQFMSEA